MPRLMKAIGRFVVPLVLFGLLAGACTGGGRETPSSTGSRPSAGSTTPTPVVSISAGPGVFVYQNAGLVATLHLAGSKGTLEIDNKTGRELPPPAFYLLDARDGHRVEGTVAAPKPTPDATDATFDVTFSGLQVWNVGLAVLVMGSDNFGAFVRQ
jgi:hypothetical protein